VRKSKHSIFWRLFWYGSFWALRTSREPRAMTAGLFHRRDGGQSTLFVTPAGKSLLIDTGWAGNNGLDAGRIAAAAKDAGVTRSIICCSLTITRTILVSPELLARNARRHVIDHGPESPLIHDKRPTRPISNFWQTVITPHNAQAWNALPIPGIRQS